MEDERDDIIVMEDEQGNPVGWLFLKLEYKEKTYVLMQTVDESDEDSYIFEYEEENEEDAILTPVEDEQLLDELFDLFVKKMDSDMDEEEE